MSGPNSSSLFHYTKELSYLIDLLDKGFRYSYSYEVYPKSIVHNEKPNVKKSFLYHNPEQGDAIAIPMICFCDIPLGKVDDHCKKYGKYAIGIDKEIARSIYGKILNPVHYLSSSDDYLSLSDVSVIKELEIEGCHNLKTSVNNLIALSKRYDGIVLDDERCCFYNEREWRIFWQDDKNTPYSWEWNIHFDTRDEFKKWREPLNEKLNSSEFGRLSLIKKDYLSASDEESLVRYFTHIIVSDDSEIEHVVNFIIDSNNSIFGYKNISNKTRHLLVSKITSISRIKKDY